MVTLANLCVADVVVEHGSPLVEIGIEGVGGDDVAGVEWLAVRGALAGGLCAHVSSFFMKGAKRLNMMLQKSRRKSTRNGDNSQRTPATASRPQSPILPLPYLVLSASHTHRSSSFTSAITCSPATVRSEIKEHRDALTASTCRPHPCVGRGKKEGTDQSRSRVGMPTSHTAHVILPHFGHETCQHPSTGTAVHPKSSQLLSTIDRILCFLVRFRKRPSGDNPPMYHRNIACSPGRNVSDGQNSLSWM